MKYAGSSFVFLIVHCFADETFNNVSDDHVIWKSEVRQLKKENRALVNLVNNMKNELHDLQQQLSQYSSLESRIHHMEISK